MREFRVFSYDDNTKSCTLLFFSPLNCCLFDGHGFLDTAKPPFLDVSVRRGVFGSQHVPKCRVVVRRKYNRRATTIYKNVPKNVPKCRVVVRRKCNRRATTIDKKCAETPCITGNCVSKLVPFLGQRKKPPCFVSLGGFSLLGAWDFRAEVKHC